METNKEIPTLEKLIPTIIVTNERWSRDPYVIFEGENLIGGAIADDWINDRMAEAGDNVERGDVEEIMIDEFESENDSVDEFWPEQMICRSGDNYYQYDDGGMAKYIGNFDSIDEAIA